LTKSAADLAGIPLKTLKVGLRPQAGALNSVECAGQLIRTAFARAGISQKEAAITMALNEGQLTRQLQDIEHLSWQRLFRLPDSFFVELLIVIAESRGLAVVRTSIAFRRRA